MNFPSIPNRLAALFGLSVMLVTGKLEAGAPLTAIRTNGVLRLQWSAESLYPVELRSLPPGAGFWLGQWNASQFPVSVDGELRLPHYLVEGTADLLNWELISSNSAPAFGPKVSQSIEIPLDEPAGGRFFRVRRGLNARVGTQFRWPWVGANLSGADLAGAQLMGADLRWANFNEADLRGADLTAANLFGAKLSGALTNAAILPDAADSVEDPDAQLIALELSGELEAPPLLYEQLRHDLQLIRTTYPVVRGIRFSASWEPGVILHYRDLSTATGLGQLLTPRPFRTTASTWHLPQRYHPVALAQQWQKTMIPGPTALVRELGDPSNNITADPVSRRYEFLMAWGDCVAGCIAKHRWVFAIVGEEVQLLEETGPPVELFPDPAPQSAEGW